MIELIIGKGQKSEVGGQSVDEHELSNDRINE